MRGIVVRGTGTQLETLDEGFLENGNLLVDVEYSDINYKDALAVTGKPGVVRRDPLIAGIDLVGTVRESSHERWNAGDTLILNGAGLSETEHGGYATVARIDGTLAVPVPEQFSPAQAAALGTAGYTAALAVLRIIMEGVSPEDGPVLVTGATGGVGSIATMLLDSAGFTVAAVTGRDAEFKGYLEELGATVVLPRADLEGEGRPLQRGQYAAVVDTVGGEILANAIARTVPSGVVAACGNAASIKLPTNVMPFILRGVTLAGIDSVNAPLEDREDAWRALALGIDSGLLDRMTSRVSLDGVISASEELLAGKRHGRTLVEVNK